MPDFEIKTDDLAPEAIIAKLSAEHDGVAELVDSYEEAEEKAEVADEAAEALDLDDTAALVDEAERLSSRVEELEAKVDEAIEEKMQEHAEFLAERTDRFGEDAEAVIEAHKDQDEPLESIKDTREMVEELAEPTADAKNANPEGDETPTRHNTYALSPWE